MKGSEGQMLRFVKTGGEYELRIDEMHNKNTQVLIKMLIYNLYEL